MKQLAVYLLLLATSCAKPGASGRDSANPPHAPDLTISDIATSADGDGRLFTSYNPDGPCRWNQGWPWKFDLSGVGWDQATTATAITPIHVVMAAHFQRKVGTRVVFHDRSGKAHQREIRRIISLKAPGLRSDTAIGLLDRALPKSIRTYPLLTPRDDYWSRLVGARALVTDQKRELFVHQISYIGRNYLRFRHDDRLKDSRKKNLIQGDSGNPSFILSHQELVLVETHSGGGPGSGPFYGDPPVVSAVRKAVEQLDSSYRIRTVGLDRTVLEDAKAAIRDNASVRQLQADDAPIPYSRPAPATKTPSKPALKNPSEAPGPRKPRPRLVVPPKE